MSGTGTWQDRPHEGLITGGAPDWRRSPAAYGLQLAQPSHAVGKLESHAAKTPFQVTGVDYATRDGSAIRDYIHVWDLALAHVAALREMDRIVEPGVALPTNVGTGTGRTVREVVAVFRAIVGEFAALDPPAARPRHRQLHP